MKKETVGGCLLLIGMLSATVVPAAVLALAAIGVYHLATR